MLSEGRGAAKDVEAAYAWIASADLAGDNRGQMLLRSLETRLTKEQLERSKARARQLSPTPETQYRASLQP
jgi:TPR repeat protein